MVCIFGKERNLRAVCRASNTNDIAYANKVWSAVVAGGEEEAQTNFQDAQVP